MFFWEKNQKPPLFKVSFYEFYSWSLCSFNAPKFYSPPFSRRGRLADFRYRSPEYNTDYVQFFAS